MNTTPAALWRQMKRMKSIVHAMSCFACLTLFKAISAAPAAGAVR